ncbi:hypothetical protein GCM10010199_53540 [Dactylosporangium roseum]
MLSLGLPAALVPSGRGLVGWSWLRGWLSAAPSWAKEDPKVPQQQRGKGADGHYVSAPRAKDTESTRKAKGELPRYEPFTPEVKNKSTGPARKGFDAATSRRKAALSDAKADVFENADGTYTRRVYKNPVNFKAADGSWQPIDSTLKVGASRRLETTANAFKVSFAAGTAKKVDADGAEVPTAGGAAAPVDEDLVRMTLGPGAELGYTLRGASLVKASVNRSVASYRNAFPNVDLEIGAKASGIKENLVLRSADVPTEYVYPLRLKGLTARLNSFGEVEFVTAKGDVASTMPVGFMEDASNSHAGAGEISYGVKYELVRADGGPALKVSIDGSWLRDPKRQFPVILDPQTLVVTQYDTYAINTAPTGTRNTEPTLAVGSHNGTEKARTFINFDGFPAMMGGQKLDSARLYIFMTYQGDADGNPCVARPYNVYPITNTWNASSVTWNAMPGYDTSKLIATDSPSSSLACTNSGQVRNKGVWSTPWLSKQYMVDWASYPGTIFGFALTADEADTAAWKRFTSSDTSLICPSYFGNTACDPFIEVNYAANTPPQLDARYPANNTTLNTLTPEFAAKGSDPDNYPNRGLRYNFLLYNDQGAQFASSGWTDGYWKPPAGTLQWGKTYMYMVQVDDRSSVGPTNPVPYVFSTAVPQQLVSSSLAQNGGKGFEGSVGNYTTSDVDAQVATVGPALSIAREYNSLDTRNSAFGRGWSSLPDMQVREGRTADNALQTAVIRYPNGQDITFGRNNDGTWTPPPGRFSVFKPITGGYSLTDKDSTAYEFTQNVDTGIFGLTKITDASGRALTVRYDANGRVDQLKSVASNRTLNLQWSTPAGANVAHIASVTTDPTDPAVPTSTMTWNYTYDGDTLTKVCPPGTTTDCAGYQYQVVNRHNSMVLNTGPYSFWRLNEPSGQTQAYSGVLSNDGIDNGIYSNVTLGGSPSLAWSSSTSASFNGTNSSVKLPVKLAAESSYQSISMWFKTTATTGVLFSYQKDLVTQGATTPAYYNPALYIDNTGKLRGSLWNGATNTIVTGTAVNDGQWHHVALAGNGGDQRLYLDATLVGSMAGAIQLHNTGEDKLYIGAGFLSNAWPGSTISPPTATFFNGSIADVAYYNKPLTQELVSSLYFSGKNPTPAMTKVTSNAGRVRATIGYDTVSSRVNQVTDENGRVWKIGAPANYGSSQVYVSSVLGSQPRDYYRFNDISAPISPSNQVIGTTALYNNVAFDTTQPNTTSPFSDSYGGIFNGTSSYVKMKEGFEFAPDVGPQSIEMWFKTPAGHAASGVLYGYQDQPLGASNVQSWVPALYVGGDGKLRGSYWTGGGTAPITSISPVNDGKWHHVVLVGTNNPTATSTQTLYLDNVPIGTNTGDQQTLFTDYSYVGAGTTKLWPGSTQDVSYFKGNIAEFAYYNTALSQAQVDAHYKASRSSLSPAETGPVLTPVTTVAITDPGNNVAKKMFDTLNGNRLVADVDVLGNTTTYGYDVGGFVSVVYDPLGQKTETGKDARGNTIRTTTCGHYGGEAGDNCETTYYKYWPDPAPAVLTPDPRNDQLIEITPPSSSLDLWQDHSTKLEYDSSGNRLKVTSPPVPGFGNGRTTATTYTTSSTAAVGGGVTPPGLPVTVISAGGKQQKTEYNSAGDAVRITDPAGLVTEFKYDGLGRVTEKKVISTAYPTGKVTAYTYDSDGQLVETTEPATTDAVTGAVHTAKTVDVYDADGNVISRTVTDTTGGDAPRAITNDYNVYGQLVKTVDPTGAVSLFSYDAYGQQDKIVECDSSPAPSTPCPAADVLRTVAHAFDAEGRLLTTSVTGKDGVGHQVVSNAYYKDGMLASQTDAMNWTTKYTYYNNGKVKKVTRTDGVKTYVLEENAYDKAGNLLSRTENNGATHTDFTFDAVGRMQSSSTNVGEVNRSTNYVYDADDRVMGIRDSVAAAGGGNTTVLQTREYTYDPMGRVLSESTSTQAASRPVGWWKLDETSQPGQTIWASDSSTSQHHATGYDGVTLGGGNGTFTTGMLDAFNILNTTQSYSVSAWVKASSLTGFQTALGQGAENSAAFYLQYSGALNKWAFISPSSDSASPSAYPAATSSNALAANTWVHLVGVFDANTKGMALYVNNVRGTDGTNPTPFASTGSFGIGGVRYNNGGVNQFNGSIDNVQIYQRALSAADVATLWAGGNGRTTDATASTGQLTTNHTVDNRGLTTATVDPNGNTTNFVYDEVDRLVKTMAPSVTTETFGSTALAVRPTSLRGYNTFGDVVEQQDPLGRVTQVRVDAAGRPVNVILPDYTPPGGTTIVGANSTTVYDRLGQVTSTTDPRGKTTSYEYDSFGNTTKVTGPTGKSSTAVYDTVGDLLEAVDPTGAKTTATYDYLGRKLTSTQIVRQPTSVANTTTYDYGTGVYGSQAEAGPWLRKITSPDGVTTETTYNNVGEPVTSKDGAGNLTKTTYNGLGQPIIVTNADNTATDMLYDGAGRVTRVRQLDNNYNVLTMQIRGYDNNGNLTSFKDSRGTTTTLVYDAVGNVTSEVQPVTGTMSITTSFGYDASGSPTRFTDGRNNQFWTTYNTWGLPESRIEPATTAYPNEADRTFTAVYDAAGRLTSKTLPGGVQLAYTYDDLNQLTGQTGSGAEAATAARTFGYDDAGRITSLSVPGGTNAITYDDRGLPLSITGPADNTSYTYTNDGLMKSRTDAAGTTNFGYDTAGRLKTVSNPTTNIDLNVAYNAMNQPSTITYGANNKKRAFTYDFLHRLKTDTVSSFDGTVIQGSVAYGYDENSNLTSKVTTGFAGASSNSYTYDLANRLTSWTSGSTTTSYAYDASGNRTQNGAKTFSYDQRNQLLSQSGGTSYAYTARGTLRLTSGPGGVYNTTADAYGQIVTQQAAGGTTTYDYDALGRAVKAGFKYSGLGNDLADDGSTKYTRDPAGEVLAAGSGTGANSRYVWTDLHTDIVGQFTATGSSLTGSASYDPLGTVLATTGMVGSLGYQSEFTEQATGRVNMLARWYNTDTGQFDSRDTADNSPVPSSINANRYQYGDGNPLTTIDPTGHLGWRSAWNAVKSVAAPVVNVVTSTYNYVASGQAWQDAKSAYNYVADKAKQAAKTVVKSTTKWVKQKVQTVKDKYHDAKKCLSGGVTKCVKETAKAAAKSVKDTVKNTVNAIKEDPWKFIATAAVGIVATIAVGALCATGVGCLILAGAVAGAMSSGAGYMIDVGRGDAEFSWSGLADTMIQGGLDGALSAGTSKFTGGASKYFTKGGAGSAAPKLFGGGGGSKASLPSPTRASHGGGGGRPSTSSSDGKHRTTSSSSGSTSRSSGSGGSSGEYKGRHRAESCDTHSFDPATRVLMADGSTKAIGEVEAGDWVMAQDPETGTLEAKQVEALHRNQDTDLTDLTITVERGEVDETAVLKTTWHHPFWNEDTDTWTDAQDLRPGDQVRTADGAVATVTTVANRVGAAEMRDLTVADIHTYYVIVGDEPILVHNNDGCKKTAVFGVQEHSNKLANDLRGANPGRTYETYNDPKLARVAPGEFRPAWMNRVSDAVHDSDGYDIAISLDGLGRYGSNPAEIFQNAVKEGGRLDGRGLPLSCATCWELRQVARAVAGGSRSAGSVSFFNGGAKLDDFNPFD